jgi:hypothetical protein
LAATLRASDLKLACTFSDGLRSNPDSCQLLELTNRYGAETYRSAQCAPTER